VSSSAKITVGDQLSVYSLLADAAARAPQATAITFLPSMESEPIRLTHGAFPLACIGWHVFSADSA
jgi:hypothetical protein